jgi:hypothetical protein
MPIIKIGNSSQGLSIRIGNIVVYENSRFTRRTISQGLSFPNNAHFLAPDVNGNFTKAMVDNAIALGEEYIVFDATSVDIHYEDAPHIFGGGVGCYLYLNGIKAAALNPITLDFRKVSFDCFHDPLNIFGKHDAIVFEECENVTLKLGTVTGDKFKREFTDPNEINEDGTGMFVRSGKGTKNLIVESGDLSGFMSDAISSIVYGPAHIDGVAPESGKNYYLQGDGRYESVFFNVDPTLYSTFGLVGGVGFNRLLSYDMEDVTFKFYDISDNFISEITGAQYYITYEFPVTARKMKVNVKPMDGRIETPTNFGHNLDYNPNSGTIVRNMRIGDNHRGGIANIGANAIIENVEFYQSARYYTAPEFPQSTRYHLNCEDAVSRNLVVNNNSFADKFHKILLTHNISADITNNTFTGGGYCVSIGYLLYGSITGNALNGSVNGGIGTNKSTVLGSNNTGDPDLILTNGVEWKLNNFDGGSVSGMGKCNNNTFANTNFGGIVWNKEVHSNTITGDNGVPYTYAGAYIYNNNFINKSFRFQHSTAQITFDSVTIDNTSNTSLIGFERTYGDNTIVCVNGTFKNLKITQGNTVGDWYFDNCAFQDVQDFILNLQTLNAVRFFFKDCSFTGDSAFLTVYGGTALYEITFDNCTFNGVALPPNYVNGTVIMPALIEPRTQITPVIIYNTDHTTIRVEDDQSNQHYHIISLIIRNKNTLAIILNEDVIGLYSHYNTTPADFEYSIDGGVYWDSL